MVILEMFKCPNCSKRISISSIKGKFNCSYCKALLKSNLLLVLILLIIGWSIIVPPIATYLAPRVCEDSSTCYGITEAVLGIIIFFPLIPVLLKVEIMNDDK